MTDYSDFTTRIRDWANRQDWSDQLVASYVAMANEKLNSELRIDRMIQFDEALIIGRCAPLPDDWLQMDLIRIADPTADSNAISPPIRYMPRDDFFNGGDRDTCGSYTIQGRQIFLGGSPDAVNGRTIRITYYAEVPVFSDATPSWVYTKYPSLYLYASMMHADLHAIGEEQNAANMKTLCEDMITKLNNDHLLARASGSRLIRTRTRSFG